MFASIFIPHFPVQALVRNEPDLLGKAVAILDGVPPLLKVFAANPAAFAGGVELGITRLKAETLPVPIAVRPRSTAQETSAHAALLDSAGSFSPRVEDSAPDTVVLDLEGLERLFGSFQEIASLLYDQTVLIGLQPNVAVAVNPDTAIQAARGFEGISVIPKGTERKRLAVLPLHVLTSDPNFLETLHRWGIHTFGAYADLPATRISERLGQEGVRLQKLARGALMRPLDPYQESHRFEEMMELEHSIALLEPLTFVLSRMLDQICCRLRVRNRATHEVRVKLDAYERVLRLPLPVCDPKLLVKLLMLDLESHPPSKAVSQVQVEAIPTRPRTVQNGLFVPLAPEPEKLELTLARIAHIVGKENVGSPQVLDSHRPDAFRVERFGKFGDSLRIAPAIRRLSPFLCLRQFRPPLEATVQISRGEPVWIAFQGLSGTITKTSGPWHASGEWWREDRWEREEWDVGIDSRVKGFAMYRIYRDTASGQWFADGVYD